MCGVRHLPAGPSWGCRSTGSGHGPAWGTPPAACERLWGLGLGLGACRGGGVWEGTGAPWAGRCRQLLQQESEWQAQTAAVCRQLEAQTAAVVRGPQATPYLSTQHCSSKHCPLVLTHIFDKISTLELTHLFCFLDRESVGGRWMQYQVNRSVGRVSLSNDMVRTSVGPGHRTPQW